MFPALLTTLCYSLSVVFASRSTKYLGAPLANCLRLLIALAMLGLWSAFWGTNIPADARRWLWLSGLVGICLGDIALFIALERIGPRLTLLLNQCLAAPLALLFERVWLGTTISLWHGAAVLVILLGVALALKPDRHLELSRRGFGIGVLWGMGAAVGQGGGAVLSRYAGELATFDGGSAALQRMLAGTVCTLTFYALAAALGIRGLQWRKPVDARRGALWASANAFFGPALGIACFQWAILSAPAGVVLAIVSTSPLVAMLWLWRLDGQIPPRGAVSGGFLAVAGVIALHWLPK